MTTIGIFDSGLGGLSMLRDIQQAVPGARIVYYGDTANVPYGGRPLEDIERLSLEALEVVRRFNPDLVVVACNTATSVAIQKLRSVHSELPIVGVVPVLKKAVEASTTKKISVLATAATLASHSYVSLKQTFAHDADVLDLALPEWVTFVEQGNLDSADVVKSVQTVAKQVQQFGADVIALGCTHFPFLRPLIESALPGVAVLDSGEAVARQIRHVLEENFTFSVATKPVDVEYWCSGDPDAFSRVAAKLLGQSVTVKKSIRS